ncbi:MAG TPA: acyl-CoA dehydrogenase family protein, partial [Dehalococcoidia bacterium]|nr:acyl-CoA dehydrogenase family protein [Dehalococcoidia bacterium]
LVREENLACDVRARETIAQLATELQALYLLAYRVAWLGDQHRIPEWEAPMVKLMLTEFMKKFSSAAIDILGPRGLLRSGSKGALMQGTLEWMYRHAARRTISAGTSEIMRNTIAQRALGMPR